MLVVSICKNKKVLVSSYSNIETTIWLISDKRRVSSSKPGGATPAGARAYNHEERFNFAMRIVGCKGEEAAKFGTKMRVLLCDANIAAANVKKVKDNELIMANLFQVTQLSGKNRNALKAGNFLQAVGAKLFAPVTTDSQKSISVACNREDVIVAISDKEAYGLVETHQGDGLPLFVRTEFS